MALALTLTAGLAFIASTLATWFAIPWLTRLGAVAEETGRSMHVGRIPKGGGAPLLLAAALATAVGGGILDPTVAIATVVLAAVSWKNDRAHVSACIRLPIHIAAALAVVLTLPADAFVFQGFLPIWLDRAATVIALAWMINLYNFMDGINGLAGSETIAICLGYILIAAVAATPMPHTGLAAALAGASGGFLVWNFRERALIFLGDVGSVSLGFLIGVLMIDLAVRGLWATALILPAYFIADATWTLLRRLSRGERVWEAHKSHAYQRGAQGYGRHLAVVWRVTIVNSVLLALAALSVSAPAIALMLAAATVAFLMALFNAAGQVRSSDNDP